MAKLTISGPIVVPKLLIPPAKVKRCEPVFIGPNAIAKGLATVCCNENPKATIINQITLKEMNLYLQPDKTIKYRLLKLINLKLRNFYIQFC